MTLDPVKPPDETRLLVIGATGQVGAAVSEVATRSGAFGSVIRASRTLNEPTLRIDLADETSVLGLLEATQPTHVVLTAATTNVAWCEQHPDESRRVNVDGVKAVTSGSSRLGAHLTFISTDYVFDGTSGPYAETDTTRPINVYGAQKLEAEQLVLDSADALVVRTCQVFGPDPRRANFVLRTVDSALQGRGSAAAVNLFGTPTFAPDLGRIIVDLVRRGKTGVWHVAGAEHLSRFELATMAVRAFGGDELVIRRATAATLSDGVPRPLMSGLRCARLESIGVTTTPLRQALALLASAEVVD